MGNTIHYKALVVTENGGEYRRELKDQTTDSLPSGEILIRVHYSSLNYKDALSATGNKGVTKNYPHTPGIDAAGIVVESESGLFHAGDPVIVSGYDLGMNTSGGFGGYIRVPAGWVVSLPENLSLKEAMILGTAGFTAGISVARLVELVKPADGPLIVTGATGGVGSVAANILSGLGYNVVAVSGKKTEYDYLKKLGVQSIIDRDEFFNLPDKPILSAQYAGGIDTVGGKYLEHIVKSLKGLGAVTTCGSVAGTSLNVSVFPFILRGISLIGVSAQNYPMEKRVEIWKKLSGTWKPKELMSIFQEISLEEVSAHIDLILQGKIKGRTLIKLN